MDLDLPKEVLAQLPEPGSDGVIRCTAGIKVSPDGEAELVELNDTPIPSDDEDEEGQECDQEDESGDSSTPDLGAMADQIYGRNGQ